MAGTSTAQAEGRPARYAVLLRGVNLVKRNRIAMPELRAALEAEAFADVQTYVQSGNVVLSSRASPDRVATEVRALIRSRFGFDIAVIVRTGAELAEVVICNPLADVALEPNRHLVTFLSDELPRETVDRLRNVAAPKETFAILGREIYSWHPAGFGRTPLWERLASKSLGVTATSRNWTTVTALAAMANQPVAR